MIFDQWSVSGQSLPSIDGLIFVTFYRPSGTFLGWPPQLEIHTDIFTDTFVMVPEVKNPAK